MKHEVKAAILALVAAEGAATEAEREAIVAAINGTATVSKAEAARRLGVTRQTVAAYVRRGILYTAADGRRIPAAALSSFAV